MEWLHVKGNTWALAGDQLVGVYILSPDCCVLFDPGSSKLLCDHCVVHRTEQLVAFACRHLDLNRSQSLDLLLKAYSSCMLLCLSLLDLLFFLIKQNNVLSCIRNSQVLREKIVSCISICNLADIPFFSKIQNILIKNNFD